MADSETAGQPGLELVTLVRSIASDRTYRLVVQALIML